VAINLSPAVSSDAPQLPEIVIVCPTTVARLVKISTSSAWPSRMFAYEIVRDEPVTCERDIDTHPEQKLAKLVAADKFIAGSACSDTHPWQKLFTKVTFIRGMIGNRSSDTHPWQKDIKLFASGDGVIAGNNFIDTQPWQKFEKLVAVAK